MCACFCNHLCYMNELGEDFCSLLWGVSVEDHELNPLRHSVTKHDWALQGRVMPHWAVYHVTTVVQELYEHTQTDITFRWTPDVPSHHACDHQDIMILWYELTRSGMSTTGVIVVDSLVSHTVMSVFCHTMFCKHKPNLDGTSCTKG